MVKRMVVVTILINLSLQMESFIAEIACVVRLTRRGGLPDGTDLGIPMKRRGWVGRELIPFTHKIKSTGMTNCSHRVFILV